MAMTREWVISAYEGYDALTLRSCEHVEPGPDDVRLRMEAFALNWGDNDLMHDNYSFSFTSLPARVGIEGCGIVDAVGDNVTDVKLGERYCTLPYFYDDRGVSAESVVVNRDYVTKAPDGLSAVEAASVWMQFLTAYYPMIELVGAKPGVNILIPAGTSTAGTAAIQMARQRGAFIISTTRSAANTAYLTGLGADAVYVDDGGDIAGFIRDVTRGQGVHAAFDPVGGDFMERYAPAMAKGGQLFLYGGLRGNYSHPPFIPMIQNSLWFHAYSVFNYIEDADVRARGLNFVHAGLASGDLKPQVDRVFPMEGYQDAWRYLRGERHSHGKVVVSCV